GIRDRTVTGVQTCALPIFLELEDALLLLCRVGVEHLAYLALERVDILRPCLVVDPGHHRGGEVQDLLELLRSHVEQVADSAGNRSEERRVGKEWRGGWGTG